MKMNFRLFLRAACLVCAAVGCVNARAESSALHVRPERYPQALVTLVRGGAEWSPLEDFGPVVCDGSRLLGPRDYRARLVSSTETPDGLRCVYRVDGVEKRTEFALTLRKEARRVTITVEGLAGEFHGVTAGRMRAAPEITGFTIPERTKEDYPQHGRYPDIFYHRKLGLWLRGGWDLDYGNAGSAETLYPRRGAQAEGIDAVYFPGLTLDDGSKPEGLEAYHLDQLLVYVPRRDGTRWPLRERFRLDFAERLWDAVAPVEQRPSPYRDEMRRLLYLDLWGGDYEDRAAFTRWLQAVAGKWVGGLTILQDWQGGGFDSHLPLAISDALPPNPKKAGTPEQLKAWMDELKGWGRAGLRTNYQWWRDTGNQPVGRALKVDGTPKWHTQPQEVLAVIGRQEYYIQAMLGTTATFSDQITSGGTGWPYVEFSPANPAAGTIRGARQALRDQARAIKAVVPGPLLSETLNSQFLIGEDVDSGDYGMFEGFRRMITPEFKLRRLHHLTTFYGMGLGYRYFFVPPYAQENRQNRGNALYASPWGPGSDDYRAMTIAYGNAAYLDYLSTEGMHPDKALTEAMTVGLLQIHYVGEPVREIDYQTPEGWRTLEALLLEGRDPRPCFARIRVRYENGFTVIVNRADEPLAWSLPRFGPVRLPKHAYAAYSADGSVEGFSGLPGAAGEAGRIDYTRDDARRVRFVNPRATGYEGLVAPTIFEDGAKVYELPPEKRVRSRAAGTFEDAFGGPLSWVAGRNTQAKIATEGETSFVRLESEGGPVRIDKPVGLILGGRVTVRYRTQGAAGVDTGDPRPVASVSLMRFGEVDGVVRELPGRKAWALPDTGGVWTEAAYPFELSGEGSRHVILRLAVNDPEIPGIAPRPAVADFDHVRIDPVK